MSYLYRERALGCGALPLSIRLLLAPFLLPAIALLHMVRMTVLALLMMFEPLVACVLSGLTVLGFLSAVALEASAMGQTFPFWRMVALAFASTMLLAAYHALLRVLSR